MTRLPKTALFRSLTRHFGSDVFTFDKNAPVKPMQRRSPDHQVAFVRHGQSEWNAKNLFTGWYDSPLTEAGSRQALRAGQLLKLEDFAFDVVFVSKLVRSQSTAEQILEEMRQEPQLVEDWRLNERHYGALTGLDKTQMAQKYGEDQVLRWRRSFDGVPPPMNENHPYYQSILETHDDLDRGVIPRGESLKMTMKRVLRFWLESAVPAIRSGKKILVVAHNNTLRAIIKYLEHLSDEQIVGYTLPVGMPFTYTLDGYMRPVRNKRLRFLGSVGDIEKARRIVRGSRSATSAE